MKALPILHCFGLAAVLCVLLSGGGSRPLSAQAAQTASTAPIVVLRTLPGGRPDLQGLWMKSAGGFQGLFIGSLDGTNFAAGGGRAGGRGAGRRPCADSIRIHAGGRSRENGPSATRIRRSRSALPSTWSSAGPRSARRALPGPDHPGREVVALLHEAMHDVRIIPTDNSPHPRNYWAWDGDSRGRWDGDTLVVDVSNFNGRTWLDMAGKLRRRERTRRRAVHAWSIATPSST